MTVYIVSSAQQHISTAYKFPKHYYTRVHISRTLHVSSSRAHDTVDGCPGLETHAHRILACIARIPLNMKIMRLTCAFANPDIGPHDAILAATMLSATLCCHAASARALSYALSVRPFACGKRQSKAADSAELGRRIVGASAFSIYYTYMAYIC